LSIENRVAVIAGATGGLGSVAARRLAEEGARLALLSTNVERLEQLAAELNLPPDRYLTAAFDFTAPGAAHAAADAVITKFGRAEVLVNVVGGWAGGKSVVEVPADEMANMLNQHLWTTFYLAQSFVPHLTANKWGRVVVISSPFASNPAANGAPYAAAKAAQEALIMGLAREVVGTGVTANILQVRAIDVNHERDRERTSKNASWTTPEETVAAVLYLCSDEARVVNGARIPLYGGG
jgi:NAD(P)-dependent dehydrogenase (short-subunit alcohol dehydrogenase family)